MRQINNFTWQGASSDQFGLRVLTPEIPRPSPGGRYEQVQVDGRDGDLYIDLKSVPSANYNLPVHLLDVARSQEIVDWLRSGKQGDLLLSWDPDYIYRAAFLDDFDIKTKLIKLGRMDLRFKLHPWKYLASGRAEVTGTSITNPTDEYANPVYKISGSGNITVNINGELLKLRNMSGTIIIDTERDVISGPGLSAANVLTYPFPKLQPGLNSFDKSITVIPNWRARL